MLGHLKALYDLIVVQYRIKPKQVLKYQCLKNAGCWIRKYCVFLTCIFSFLFSRSFLSLLTCCKISNIQFFSSLYSSNLFLIDTSILIIFSSVFLHNRTLSTSARTTQVGCAPAHSFTWLKISVNICYMIYNMSKQSIFPPFFLINVLWLRPR